MRSSWLSQIVTIENKGYRARLYGALIEDCPYQSGYRNQNGPGGSLQRQRREAWLRGYKLAMRQER